MKLKKLNSIINVNMCADFCVASTGEVIDCTKVVKKHLGGTSLSAKQQLAKYFELANRMLDTYQDLVIQIHVVPIMEVDPLELFPEQQSYVFQFDSDLPF